MGPKPNRTPSSPAVAQSANFSSEVRDRDPACDVRQPLEHPAFGRDAPQPGRQAIAQRCHREPHHDRGHEEQDGQDGREPQRVQPVRHVEVERPQRGLVQGRQRHRRDRKRDDYVVDRVRQFLPVQLFQDLRADLDHEHGRIQQDAPADFEQRRVHVPEDDEVVEPVRPPQVEHEQRQHGRVAEQAGQHCGPQGRAEFLPAQDINESCHGKRRAREGNQAEIETDPNAPRHVVGQRRRRAEAGRHAPEAGDDPHRHQQRQKADRKLESQLALLDELRRALRCESRDAHRYFSSISMVSCSSPRSRRRRTA